MATGKKPPITNVFVLMLENHSFDNIFAMSGIPGIIAATTNDINNYNGKSYPVIKGAPSSMPSDPGHEFQDVAQQLTGTTYPHGGPYRVINNSGFAANYATTTSEGPVTLSTDVSDIMACFDTQKQLPVIYQLATEFAVCDHWFASIPGPTWPNRFFVHGASSTGLDHSPTMGEEVKWEAINGFGYPNGSVFDALDNAKIPWRIYCDEDGPVGGSITQVSSLKNIHLWDVHSLKNLAADLSNAYPSKYTFIEPNYGDVVRGTFEGGSSQHPMDDVYGGENLIKKVYEAIRNSPVWDTSLLIITYDEHGGFYDSVKPGKAIAPADNSPATYNQNGFDFTQYGVRVPAVIISPLIAKGTVDHAIYDHSSVPSTLEHLFGIGSLTKRDANANNVLHLLSEPTLRTDCPFILNDPAPAMKRAILPLSAEAQTAIDLEPIPDSGNFIGFLHVMLKTDFELSSRTEAEKVAILARFQLIKTRGEADAYISEVMSKVAAEKAK